MHRNIAKRRRPVGAVEVSAATGAYGSAPGAEGGAGHAGLLDYEAAARYLCTTPRHVRELWARRHLAAVKVGRHVRFRTTDLDAFITAHRVPPAR
jgi:excisionase family DNA binding protein